VREKHHKKKNGNNAGNLILLLILGNGEMCAEKKIEIGGIRKITSRTWGGEYHETLTKHFLFFFFIFFMMVGRVGRI